MFSYQGSFCLLLSLASQLIYNSILFFCCQELFSSFFDIIFSSQNRCYYKRRRRDLNPRAAVNDLLPFQGSPFGQLGYFSKLPFSYHIDFRLFNMKRRGWDSNPRALADKRFSRPPRYDHFDTSPRWFVFMPLSQRHWLFYHTEKPESIQNFKFFGFSCQRSGKHLFTNTFAMSRSSGVVILMFS